MSSILKIEINSNYTEEWIMRLIAAMSHSSPRLSAISILIRLLMLPSFTQSANLQFGSSG